MPLHLALPAVGLALVAARVNQCGCHCRQGEGGTALAALAERSRRPQLLLSQAAQGARYS